MANNKYHFENQTTNSALEEGRKLSQCESEQSIAK